MSLTNTLIIAVVLLANLATGFIVGCYWSRHVLERIISGRQRTPHAEQFRQILIGRLLPSTAQRIKRAETMLNLLLTAGVLSRGWERTVAKVLNRSYQQEDISDDDDKPSA